MLQEEIIRSLKIEIKPVHKFMKNSGLIISIVVPKFSIRFNDYLIV